MNFLAHLWLAERASLPLVGAVLGDVVRGRLDGRLPAALEAAIRQHRQIDAATDAHPLVVGLRAGFPAGQRRWAGVVLDVVHDHVLATDWDAITGGAEAFDAFTARAATAVADAGAWQLAADRSAPDAAAFAALLRSYRSEAGIDQAFERIARRLRRPEPLLAAAADWRAQLPALRPTTAPLLAALAALPRPTGKAGIIDTDIDTPSRPPP